MEKLPSEQEKSFERERKRRYEKFGGKENYEKAMKNLDVTKIISNAITRYYLKEKSRPRGRFRKGPRLSSKISSNYSF